MDCIRDHELSDEDQLSVLAISLQDREGLTPLHWAVMCDQPSHVRLLLTSTSADVTLQDREGRTALNFAVLNFSPACIKASSSRYLE